MEFAWQPDRRFFIPPGAEFCITCDHANSWLSVLIPSEIMPSIGLDLVRSDSGVTRERVLGSAAGAAGELWPLVERFVANAMTEPCVAQEKTSLTAFSESFVFSVSRLYGYSGGQSASERGRPSVVDFRLISSTMELIEDLPYMKSILQDLVAATGVSGRVLRTGFHKFFVVSPRK